MPRKKKTEVIEEKKEKENIKSEEIEKEIKVQKKLLVPLEEYVKVGIHLGTKIITGDMRKYIYRRRADGLAILNTNLIDDGFRKAIELLSKFDAEQVILVCKREAGWQAAGLFSASTGIKVFTKKYPAGGVTNPNIEGFFEPSLVIVCDPWLDKNAMHDARIINIPIISLCDANNLTKDVDLVVPCNNKSNKTLGLAMYILALGYCKAKKIPFKAKISDFIGEEAETKNQSE